MVRQLIALPSRGVALEVEIYTCTPSGFREAGKARDAGDGAPSGSLLVVLHPWAWLGGCMDDHVVGALCRAAVASGAFTRVVRYNMRGAGGSGGSRSLSPAVDSADLVALVRHLLGSTTMPTTTTPAPAASPSAGLTATRAAAATPALGGQGGHQHLAAHAPHQQEGQHPQPQPQQRPPQHPPAPPCRLALAAYSYGCVVAAGALGQLRPQPVGALAALAFPLGPLSRTFLRSGAPWEALLAAACISNSGSGGSGEGVRPPPSPPAAALPVLLCCGDQDQFTDVRNVQNAVQRALARAAAAAAAAPAATARGAAAAAAPVETPTAVTAAAADLMTATGTAIATMTAAVAASSSSSASSPQAAPPLLQLLVCPGCDHFFAACSQPGALTATLGAAAAALRSRGGAADSSQGGGAGSIGRSEHHHHHTPAEALAAFVVRWLAAHMEGDRP
ncbi:hypothetical protein Agub_g7617 [Astrephomene gubernaculifera]|uniref:Uncharacterized protein n=1 Tax=Astrephomene gubernaculifera TaxID=47775 RepID=A0AAD3HMK7_9CHLO|nr:hypothetical protein Agub_g7617 [Astrephomene gubernaculifera]